MNTRIKGNLGEEIACKYLSRAGFTIFTRNYLKKWGEIDIIAQKDRELHFFEVKSVNAKDGRPEENVHSLKLQKIGRMIKTYLAEMKLDPETSFNFHVLSVFMDDASRTARVKWIKNVIL